MDSEALKNMCLYCNGTGKQKMMRRAMTLDGISVRYTDISTPCPNCNGTGFRRSDTSAPRSRRTDKR